MTNFLFRVAQVPEFMKCHVGVVGRDSKRKRTFVPGGREAVFRQFGYKNFRVEAFDIEDAETPLEREGLWFKPVNPFLKFIELVEGSKYFVYNSDGTLFKFGKHKLFYKLGGHTSHSRNKPDRDAAYCSTPDWALWIPEDKRPNLSECLFVELN